jgi:hypothetical protein
MAKRDSYEDDDDFLDEEIADWDDEDELDDDKSDDEVDEADDEEDDDTDEDEADEPESEEKAPATISAKQDENESAESYEDDEEEEAPPEEPEEEIVYPPDDEKALAALRKLRVRLDVNDKGNVWRAIFDDTNGKDPSLILLKGLPALKELWLLGTKVTQPVAESFKAEHPMVKVFF